LASLSPCPRVFALGPWVCFLGGVPGRPFPFGVLPPPLAQAGFSPSRPKSGALGLARPRPSGLPRPCLGRSSPPSASRLVFLIRRLGGPGWLGGRSFPPGFFVPLAALAFLPFLQSPWPGLGFFRRPRLWVLGAGFARAFFVGFFGRPLPLWPLEVRLRDPWGRFPHGGPSRLFALGPLKGSPLAWPRPFLVWPAWFRGLWLGLAWLSRLARLGWPGRGVWALRLGAFPCLGLLSLPLFARALPGAFSAWPLWALEGSLRSLGFPRPRFLGFWPWRLSFYGRLGFVRLKRPSLAGVALALGFFVMPCPARWAVSLALGWLSANGLFGRFFPLLPLGLAFVRFFPPPSWRAAPSRGFCVLAGPWPCCV
jgi:hypothetical protein